MGRKRKTEQASDEGEAGIGHNGNGDGHTDLTDEQKQVLWFKGKKQIIAITKQIDALNEHRKEVYKLLKVELQLPKKDVDFGIAIASDDQSEAMIEQTRRRLMLAQWEGHPIGFQAYLFDEDRTPAVDKAFADGKRTGLAGDPCKNPHDPSVPQYARWMDGFHEGNAVLAKGIKAGDDLRPDFLRRAEEERASDAVDTLAE